LPLKQPKASLDVHLGVRCLLLEAVEGNQHRLQCQLGILNDNKMVTPELNTEL
jgi:hypothetical protein